MTRKVTRTVDQILADHRAWLHHPGTGRSLVWHNLIAEERAALRSAGFGGALILYADFTGADLAGVEFRESNLGGACFRQSDLTGANLSGSRLSGADLSDADLSGADLSGTMLWLTRFAYADLTGANFSGAQISGAWLWGTDLSGALGLIELPVDDPRGIRCVAVWHGDRWMISAGRFWGSAADARAQWSTADYPCSGIRDRYLRALDWLEAQPTPALQGGAT